MWLHVKHKHASLSSFTLPLLVIDQLMHLSTKRHEGDLWLDTLTHLTVRAFELKSYNENNCNTDSCPFLLGFRNNRTIVTPGNNKPCLSTDSLWIQLENLCAWLYVIRRPLRAVCPCLWPLTLKHRVNAHASMLYARAYACTRKYAFKNRVSRIGHSVPHRVNARGCA